MSCSFGKVGLSCAFPCRECNVAHSAIVYSANPSAHDDDVGYRLENFFWRIWGSRCLNHTLLGTTLASLFLRISEPNPFSLVQLSKVRVIARVIAAYVGSDGNMC